MMGSGMLLDDYIAALQKLRAKHGNVMCWTDSGDYPEGATKPYYNTHGDAYTPAKVVVLT